MEKSLFDIPRIVDDTINIDTWFVVNSHGKVIKDNLSLDEANKLVVTMKSKDPSVNWYAYNLD